MEILTSNASLLKTCGTLLVHGPYFPSMPFQLCSAYMNPSHDNERALFLSPSREKLAATLQEFNDAKFTRLTGGLTRTLRRIDMLYVA